MQPGRQSEGMNVGSKSGLVFLSLNFNNLGFKKRCEGTKNHWYLRDQIHSSLLIKYL